MPTQETITERYWCPGAWPWEWAKMCTRQETRWCYEFSSLKEYRWGAFCYLVGCENGTRYCWYAFCLNVFGTEEFFNVRKCFKSERSSCGRC